MFSMFTTALLGSLPRSAALMSARRSFAAGRIAEDDLRAMESAETERAVAMQHRAGIDIITNGEFSRDNYVSFIADHLDNVKMLSMGDMLPYIDDKKAFEQILNTLDVPSVSIKNAVCAGRISRRSDMVAGEMRALKKITSHPIKATLPGPYLMTRSMWLPKLSMPHYESKEELGEDVVSVLSEEIAMLEAAGADIVQFDEPVLTEVVFTKGRTRSFMCAALSEKKDPAEELAFATSLIKRVIDRTRNMKITSALHVCRGNWSRDESILLSGPYTPLVPLFEEAAPDVLVLEFSTARAGDLSSLLASERIREQSVLGLGVINPRIDEIESADSIVSRAEEAMRWLPPDRIWLNPDCGFATFANRPVNTYDIIEQKLLSLKRAQDILRDRYEHSA